MKEEDKMIKIVAASREFGVPLIPKDKNIKIFYVDKEGKETDITGCTASANIHMGVGEIATVDLKCYVEKLELEGVKICKVEDVDYCKKIHHSNKGIDTWSPKHNDPILKDNIFKDKLIDKEGSYIADMEKVRKHIFNYVARNTVGKIIKDFLDREFNGKGDSEPIGFLEVGDVLELNNDFSNPLVSLRDCLPDLYGRKEHEEYMKKQREKTDPVVDNIKPVLSKIMKEWK